MLEKQKWKIVLQDGRCSKCIFGYPDFEAEAVLMHVKTEHGDLMYINKQSVIFMRLVYDNTN
jgi:hypothetical protein